MKTKSRLCTNIFFLRYRSVWKTLDKMSLYVLLILAIIETTFANKPTENTTRYQLFSGHHFIQRHDLIAYETIIPMIFSTQIFTDPKLDYWTPATNETLCQNDTTRCHACIGCDTLEENLILLHNLIKNQIKLHYSDMALINQKNGENRNRRGLLFLQNFLEFCCNVATKSQVSTLFQNEKGIEEHTNKIIDSVGTQYRNLVSTTQNLNNLSKNVDQISNKVHQGFQAIKQQFLKMSAMNDGHALTQIYTTILQTTSYILYNFYQDSQREIMEKCHLNLLSENLINPQNLTSTLRELDKKAEGRGLSLAIPLSEIHLYYKIKINHCTIFGNTLVAKMHIPLIHSEIQGVFYKTVNTPLIWEDKICTLPLEQDIFFKTERYTKVISATDENCNDKSYPLCKIPRNTITTNKLQLCLHLILSSAPIDKLQENCHYICDIRPQFPIITELLPNQFLITNVQQDLTLICDNVTHSRTIKKIAAGTLKINIPCDCELLLENQILLTKIQPCDNDIDKDYRVTILIPAAWTKLKTLKLFPLESGIYHEFDNLTEIIDTDWNITNPTFVVTKLEKIQHLKLQNNDFDLFGNTRLLFYILLAWTIVLTIICLIIIYCLNIQAIKLSMIQPNIGAQSRPENIQNPARAERLIN